MTKKIIRKLAKLSFSKNALDEKKVLRITKAFKRKDLKNYIKDLKRIEKQNTVFIYSSDLESIKNWKNQIQKMFPDKKIKLVLDESLIAGVRIESNDDIYEFNLKNDINNIANFISI